MNHLVFRKKKRHGTFNPEVGHSWRIFHRKRHLLGLQYDSIFTEMAVVGGLTVRGARIVVPNSMREKVVRLAHERRQGITKTKEYLSTRVWLAKCCKIQQLAHSYSTTYIYVQQDVFIFNILYLYSTMRIFFQLQPKLFSFNKNICSTSTKHNFIQQQYLFNFNPNYFHSTKIFVQLQPNIISFNKYVCSTSTRNNFIQQRSSRTFKISSFNKIPHPVPS